MVGSGKEIQATVNQILKEMQEERANTPNDDRNYWQSGAINWGDLQCVEVHRVEDMLDSTHEGSKRIRIIIEEADPSNHDFCREILKRFEAKTGQAIEVVTEW